MDYKPVVVDLSAQNAPMSSWRQKHSRVGQRGTKIMIIIVSVIMILSMVSFAIFTVQSNNAEFSKKHGLDVNLPQTSGIKKSSAALPGGNVAAGIGGTSGTNAPVVTLTAEPATVEQGETAMLKWSATNNPKSCVASDDWSGNKPTSGGSEETPSLTEPQNYLFTLTCKTETGTGFATVPVSVASSSSIADEDVVIDPDIPVVTIAAAPALIFAGTTSTIRWEATNDPTSCTASDDWSGTKAGSGSEATAALTAIKQYTYTITCENESGASDPESAYITVQALPLGVPSVTLDASPAGPISPGGSTTLKWTTQDNPSSCTASGDWSGTKPASGTQVISNMTSIKTYRFTLSCSNSAGGTNDSVAIQVIPQAPNVSLTVSPASILTGKLSTISWSATNSPTSCTASGTGWSGTKASSGTQSTGTMSAGTYTYNLSCTNAGGTGYANNIPLTVTNPQKPVVTFTSNPISVAVGGSSNLTWAVSNSATSCSGRGDWSGAKSTSGGAASTGPLTTMKTYVYYLDCTNAGGTGTAQTSVTVTNGTTVSPPAVSISATPNPVGVGSGATVSWSATNSPTSCTASGSWSGAKSASGSQVVTVTAAGTQTYTIQCTNSTGSSTKSAVITAVAKPTVNVSVSQGTITAGSNTTVTWTTGNSPTSCTAGGTGWTGSKATGGGSQSVSFTTAGTYTFNLSCSNSGGTTTSSTASVTVNAVVYCGGRTPCYGASQLNAHLTASDCWGYNISSIDANNKIVYNITTFNANYHIAVRSINLLPGSGAVSALCGAKNFASYISGSTLTGVGSHIHKSSTLQNTNGSMNTYQIGYYDAAKP